VKKSYFLLFLLIGLAFLAGFFWHRQTQKLGKVEFDIKNINHGGEGMGYKIEGKYPVLKSGLSKKVLEIINSELRNFITESVSETKIEFDELSKEMDEIGSSAELQYLSEVKIENEFDRLPFINITFEIYYYSGGAHGITAIKTFVFDARTGEQMSLQNIFTGEYLKTLSLLSREVLKAKDPNSDIYSFAEEGTTPEPDNFSAFTLESDGMHVVFGDYQVGPYVIGHPEIVISYDKLEGVLRPEFRELVVNN
jgi:hypothetical protein